MKITVLRVLERAANAAKVEFSSAYGNGISFLCGSEWEEGGECDVELEINDELTWGVNIASSPESKPSIFSTSNAMHLTAELVACGRESGFLRLGETVVLISADLCVDKVPMFVDIISTENFLHPTYL
ncbi:hypothetical protein [Stenotrophomonas maltophilia]|uniref:hypothetical protein n=1 Tax=Stenotrophomonas maltophilia TaxID=40324 RepID=UPI003BA3CE91